MIDPEKRLLVNDIAQERSPESRPSPLKWLAMPMRPSRCGLPFGRVPQSNRSMDKPVFAALNRVLGFMAEHIGDVEAPQSIEEDGLKVKAWIDDYQQYVK
jgi:hypothetical protein